jgi:hypothetical protein
MNLKASDNIYKSYTLRPQTDGFGNDLGHKKGLSFDSQNYEKRVKNAILMILNECKQGIYIDCLLKRLYGLMGYQVRNELLGVDKFENFLIYKMAEHCNVRVTKHQFPHNEYNFLILPKHEMRTSHIPVMQPWNMYFPNVPRRSPMTSIGTPTTNDNSWIGSTNLEHLLKINPSLNPNSRKEYNLGPKPDQINTNINKSQQEKQHLRAMSYLSGISKADHPDDSSMGSYGFNHDPTPSFPKEDIGLLLTPKDSCKSDGSAKKESGFNFKVFNEYSIQYNDDDEEDGIENELRVRSYKSSDEDNRKPFLDDGLSSDNENDKIRKKQIRLSKSSNKKFNRESKKLLNLLGI